MSDANDGVATYEYDGLFRRIEKTVSNQGIGVVFRSDGGGALLPVVEGIQAANRHEHYFWGSTGLGGTGVPPVNCRLVKTTDHAESDGFYSYAAAHVLGQLGGTGVSPVNCIDEPVRYDRNTDPSTDDDCLEAGGSAAYYYHQDANYRVVLLTGEDGGVVERYAYSAYGEPTVLGGMGVGGTGVSPVNGELGNAQLVSTVGNPFQHQGLFRDTETRTYQNRFRELHSRPGRFMQRDPAAHVDGPNPYEYVVGRALTMFDPSGQRMHVTAFARLPAGPRMGPDPVSMTVSAEPTTEPGTSQSVCPSTEPPNTPGDGWCNDPVSPPLHPPASTCYRGYYGPNWGQQCCYDAGGNLIDSGPGAGTKDLFPPAAGEFPGGMCTPDPTFLPPHVVVEVFGDWCVKNLEACLLVIYGLLYWESLY
jgi:RHS repeat-associated protein